MAEIIVPLFFSVKVFSVFFLYFVYNCILNGNVV